VAGAGRDEDVGCPPPPSPPPVRAETSTAAVAVAPAVVARAVSCRARRPGCRGPRPEGWEWPSGSWSSTGGEAPVGELAPARDSSPITKTSSCLFLLPIVRGGDGGMALIDTRPRRLVKIGPVRAAKGSHHRCMEARRPNPGAPLHLLVAVALVVALTVLPAAEARAAWPGKPRVVVFVGGIPGQDVRTGLWSFEYGRSGTLRQVTSDATDRDPQISPTAPRSCSVARSKAA
jgi:hypothetical protein